MSDERLIWSPGDPIDEHLQIVRSYSSFRLGTGREDPDDWYRFRQLKEACDALILKTSDAVTGGL